MSDIALRTRLKPGDAARLWAIAKACGNFSNDELDFIPEILSELREKGAEASGYRLIVAEDQNVPVGFAIHGPIEATDQRHDLYWIATLPSEHGRGIGKALLAAAADAIRKEGGKRLFIETETGEAYASAHRLYEACGFQLIATIPDYYRDGCGKVIYGGPL